jgi:hypothetical protein
MANGNEATARKTVIAQPFLIRVPEAIPRVDALQRAVAQALLDRVVELPEQFLIGLAEIDHVEARLSPLADQFEFRHRPGEVHAGGIVLDRGVEAAAALDFLEHDRHVLALQDLDGIAIELAAVIGGDRPFEDAELAPAFRSVFRQVGPGANVFRVAVGDQLKTVGVVRDRHAVLGGEVVALLVAVEDDVDPLLARARFVEQFGKRAPVGIDLHARAAEPGREVFGELVLEADELSLVVLVHVGRAAGGVGAPAEFGLLLGDRGRGGEGKGEGEQREQPVSIHRRIPPRMQSVTPSVSRQALATTLN